jgi:hypothetical protein
MLHSASLLLGMNVLTPPKAIMSNRGSGDEEGANSSALKRKQMPVSYAADIKPIFRKKDIDSMKNFGGFDLSSYDDVKDNANNILKRLSAGNMPCDGAWPLSQVNLFKQWIDDGMQA